MSPDALRQPLDAKQLAGGVPRFGQPVGIEQQDVARAATGDRDLLEDLAAR